MAQGSNYRNRATVVGKVVSISRETFTSQKTGNTFEYVDVKVHQGNSNISVRVMNSSKDPGAIDRFMDMFSTGSLVKIHGILNERVYKNKSGQDVRIREVNTWGGFEIPDESDLEKYRLPTCVIQGDVLAIQPMTDSKGNYFMLVIRCFEGKDNQISKDFTFVVRDNPNLLQQVGTLSIGMNVEVAAYILNKVITDEFDTIVGVVNELQAARVTVKAAALGSSMPPMMPPMSPAPTMPMPQMPMMPGTAPMPGMPTIPSQAMPPAPPAANPAASTKRSWE